jgi:hypothetical protein
LDSCLWGFGNSRRWSLTWHTQIWYPQCAMDYFQIQAGDRMARDLTQP